MFKTTKTILSSQYGRTFPHIASYLHPIEGHIFNNKEKMKTIRKVLETSDFHRTKELQLNLQFLQKETHSLNNHRLCLFQKISPLPKKLSYEEIVSLELPPHKCGLQKAPAKYIIPK